MSSSSSSGGPAAPNLTQRLVQAVASGADVSESKRDVYATEIIRAGSLTKLGLKV